MGKPDVGLKGVGASFLATEAVQRFGPICAGETLVANQMGDLIETTEKSYVYKGVSK